MQQTCVVPRIVLLVNLTIFMLSFSGVFYFSETLTANSTQEWLTTNLRLANQLTSSPNSSTSHPFIVHYVLFHDTPNPTGPNASLSFMECLSVLSVMKNLAPDAIYIHTNVPEYWPFDTCQGLITNWTGLKLVNAHRKFVMNGQKITFPHHEADIRKLESVIEYGGLALDFDVFIINGNMLRDLLVQFPCVTCNEKLDLAGKVEYHKKLLNAGFLACGPKGADFPRMILDGYWDDYRADSWIWNSGQKPALLHTERPETAYIADGICNVPKPPFVRQDVREKRGYYNWTDKIAYHSVYHDRTFTNDTLQARNSTFADLLKWIMSTAPLI